MCHISEEAYRRYYREPDEDRIHYRGGDLSSMISSLSGIVNGVKDNISPIVQGVSTAGSIASGIKNIYDAAKSAEELKALKDFNASMSMLNQIKKTSTKQPPPSPQPTVKDANTESFVNQVKGGKGFKRF